MKKVSLSIYDYGRKKVCDIYESDAQSAGQAYNIVFTQEINGWKELSFELPFMIEKEKNFRWSYIKNDYLLRQVYGDETDWFIIHAPKRVRNGRAVSNTVKCSHISSLLKTKNLYLVFDDTNGIGTAQYLIGRALTNTGWQIGTCDTFYEQDGETEKVRSLSSNGKKGSYQQITDICNLFNAYPVYHGDTKTVDICALTNKKPIVEMYVGKNLETLSVETNSDSMVTRLYVEGQYGDNGYVGIDDVNPTGLPFLLNFDYYESIGLLTPEQRAAIATYTNSLYTVKATIRTKTLTQMEGENLLNDFWGQVPYVIYRLNGESTIYGGTMLEEQKAIQEGDALRVFKQTGNYRIVTAGTGGAVTFAGDDIWALKFVTPAAGKIGAREVAIESKQKMIANTQRDLNNLPQPQSGETDSNAQMRQYYTQLIAHYNQMISAIYNGTEDTTGLYEALRVAVELAIDLYERKGELDTLQSQQDSIEAAFASAMGDLLKDGYWSSTNYAVGQEEGLYWDAYDHLAQAAKPKVKYTVSLIQMSELMGRKEEIPEINTKVRILDDDMQINDIAYISKRTLYLDDLIKGSVEISNEDLASSITKSFENVLSKITQIADLVEQRSALYERARAINADGTLPVDNLIGTISIQDHIIESPKSLWHTNEKGELIFESILDDSAFKLSGDGLMIAYDKIDGEWDWEVAMDGQGINAGSLSGFIPAETIEDGAIDITKIEGNLSNQLYMDHQQLTQTATEVDDHGNILRQAGIQLDANGQIFYATDNERNLGSYLRNTAESLTALYTSGESMRSQLVMTAESLTTVFNKTGIDSLGASETLYSRQVMTAESLTTVFEKTGIDSLGNGETLYSRQVQTAESMTTLYTKTGVGDLGPGDTLYSFVIQTAESINQEVGNVEQGLYSRITQTESQISLKVSSGDVATQLSVEMENVSITNGNLVVEGYIAAETVASIYATISDLNAQKARFDNLESSTGGIVHVYSQYINASDTITGGTLYATNSLSIGTNANGGSGSLYYRGTQYYRQAITMGGVAGSIALGYFLGDSTTALNLDHYHSISASEGTGANAGRILITLGAPQVSEGSANFNIAATQFYQDGVAAARDEGKVAVTLNDPTWNAISGDLTNSRTVTVSTDGRTPSLSKSVPLFLTVSGQTVYLRADSSSGTAYAKATVAATNPTPTDWQLNYQSSPYTYKAKAKINGTWYESGTLSAPNAYDNGWSGAYGTVDISPSGAQTINVGSSVTVYARAKATSGAQSKTNVASVTVTASIDTSKLFFMEYNSLNQQVALSSPYQMPQDNYWMTIYPVYGDRNNTASWNIGSPIQIRDYVAPDRYNAGYSAGYEAGYTQCFNDIKLTDARHISSVYSGDLSIKIAIYAAGDRARIVSKNGETGVQLKTSGISAQSWSQWTQ